MRSRAPRVPGLSPSLLPETSDSLSTRVASALRRAVLSGKLKPGDRLVEDHLATQLGTSRGPVRDALKRLQQEGLLTILPRRGAFVAIPSVEEAKQMYGLRTVLEEYAATLAIDHVTDPDLARLEDCIREMDKAADGHDVFALLESDEEFHNLIWQCAQHPKLLQIRALVAPQIRTYAVVSGHLYADLHTLADDHRHIVKALRSREAERVREAMRHHVAMGAKRWVNGLAKHSENQADLPAGERAVSDQPAHESTQVRRRG